MRSYEKMVESGDWPPTNRETIRMGIGFTLGLFFGIMGTLVLSGIIH